MLESTDLDAYLARLKQARVEAAYLGVAEGVEGVQRLADLQGAIAAVEAVIADGSREPAAPGEDGLLVRAERIDQRMGFR